MSKKNVRNKKSHEASSTRRIAAALQEAAETRTAVAATVGWMLALMSTLTAEAMGLICRWYTILVAPVDLLTVMSSVMLFVALISGVITVGLVPVVLRVSQSPPPRAIVRIALVAGSLPLLVVGMRYLMFH